jgi:hypothetical protein
MYFFKQMTGPLTIANTLYRPPRPPNCIKGNSFSCIKILLVKVSSITVILAVIDVIIIYCYITFY